jgi:energy-coupling factor transporter ATP-binding protein EcfA2
VLDTVVTGAPHRPAEAPSGRLSVDSSSAPHCSCAAQPPEIVFADEPTGKPRLPPGSDILQFMRTAVDDLGQTNAMVTHDPIAASVADRVVFLADGKIVDEMLEPSADRVLDRMKSFGEYRIGDGGEVPHHGATIKGLFAKKLRLVLTSISVVLGVAFMSGARAHRHARQCVRRPVLAAGHRHRRRGA